MVSAPTFDPADPPRSRTGIPAMRGYISTASCPALSLPAPSLRRSLSPPPWSRSPICSSAPSPAPAPPLWAGRPLPAPSPTVRWTSTTPSPAPATAYLPSWLTSWARRPSPSTQNRRACWTATPSAASPPLPAVWSWMGQPPASWGWAGVGQYHDLVNPCALMVWMGGVANGGKAAVPELVLKTEGGFPHLSLHFPHRTSQLIQADTAQVLADMMAQNVVQTMARTASPTWISAPNLAPPR